MGKREFENIPKRIYMGVVNIAGTNLSCAVLNDGTRVLTAKAVFDAFKRPRRGKSAGDQRAENMPSFIDANNLKPYTYAVFGGGPENMEVRYTSKNGQVSYVGYDATILPKLCEVYLRARDANALTDAQKPLAVISDVLMRSFAQIGIIALIDEATGYQEQREKDELQKLLAVYVSKELLPWVKTFPDEFYIELFRLRGWTYKGKPKSPYVGVLTNYLVYDRLPNEVVEELKRLNPIQDSGHRKHQLFRHLNTNPGYIQLRTLILSDIAMMRGFDTWDEFNKVYQKSYKIEKPLKSESEMSDSDASQISFEEIAASDGIKKEK